MKTNHNYFLKLAFNLAKINLGKTSFNPSVGCVVVKNNSVISSGYTAIKGRPHAEFNALSFKKNFRNSDLYVTMEPCTHYGVTPPCTNLISKKGIKRVFFSFNDKDKRTAKKSKEKLSKKKIKVYKKSNKDFKDFYQSYFLTKKNTIPFVDAKIATSKDYLTINKRSKWITNSQSRNRAHLIRSEYDAIISTSKSINNDNSLLNCRLRGFDNNRPDVVIIDLNLKIKKGLNIFKKIGKRKISIVTSVSKGKKIFYLKKRGIKIISIKSLDSKNDFINLFKILKKYAYNRILIESGLIFLEKLIKNKLIFNLYMFKSSTSLGNNGKNNISSNFIKKLKLKKKINVNLYGDELFKIKIK
ncbi:bifunctional diaminohydroxyphosphoribosylaminopyrimidine deaminase/5-amino-6-(5-phosphoribosylamino)uracil reductase RibD [Pelagibacterales bacterium SAG-MED05]|nr:bifunctional diaminohydroxyphosphoribosylaminopyrimidine deaminase/5-amino-6-(5-phosphoribosylamino)uracil reductase RibD [Pelagibacterales bacterium SAG-MED05]